MIRFGRGTYFMGEGEELTAKFQAWCQAMKQGIHKDIEQFRQSYFLALRSPEQRQFRAECRRQGIMTIEEQDEENL